MVYLGADSRKHGCWDREVRQGSKECKPYRVNYLAGRGFPLPRDCRSCAKHARVENKKTGVLIHNSYLLRVGRVLETSTPWQSLTPLQCAPCLSWASSWGQRVHFGWHKLQMLAIESRPHIQEWGAPRGCGWGVDSTAFARRPERT